MHKIELQISVCTSLLRVRRKMVCVWGGGWMRGEKSVLPRSGACIFDFFPFPLQSTATVCLLDWSSQQSNPCAKIQQIVAYHFISIPNITDSLSSVWKGNLALTLQKISCNFFERLESNCIAPKEQLQFMCCLILLRCLPHQHFQISQPRCNTVQEVCICMNHGGL